MRGQEKLRSNLSPRRRGGVVKNSPDQHHPVRSHKDASRYFLKVASTPPLLRRGVRVTILGSLVVLNASWQKVPIRTQSVLSSIPALWMGPS
jgi:hypothetical protein